MKLLMLSRPWISVIGLTAARGEVRKIWPRSLNACPPGRLAEQLRTLQYVGYDDLGLDRGGIHGKQHSLDLVDTQQPDIHEQVEGGTEIAVVCEPWVVATERAVGDGVGVDAGGSVLQQMPSLGSVG